MGLGGIATRVLLKQTGLVRFPPAKEIQGMEFCGSASKENNSGANNPEDTRNGHRSELGSNRFVRKHPNGLYFP